MNIVNNALKIQTKVISLFCFVWNDCIGCIDHVNMIFDNYINNYRYSNIHDFKFRKSIIYTVLYKQIIKIIYSIFH